RALLGVAGATLMPSTLALISNMFADARQRGMAIAIWVTMFSVGIALGPLLASAGVVGLAIGFGAQSLVADYLSGLLIMVEDQYGVGDSVDLGEAVGEV
ncbi:MFS transporter, partial [Streptomyces sp. CHB19.2]|uniref:MFS transporter n=1 Tax=Streptomyces sp. CHB19.2 TaxID=2841671 RepID=UPI002096146C